KSDDRPCPICLQPFPKDGERFFYHLFTWHPLSYNPLNAEQAWFCITNTDAYLKNAYFSFLGKERLDPRFERYIVKTAKDHVRHTARMKFKKAGIVAKTTAFTGKSPPSNITHATKRKRKP